MELHISRLVRIPAHELPLTEQIRVEVLVPAQLVLSSNNEDKGNCEHPECPQHAVFVLDVFQYGVRHPGLVLAVDPLAALLVAFADLLAAVLPTVASGVVGGLGGVDQVGVAVAGVVLLHGLQHPGVAEGHYMDGRRVAYFYDEEIGNFYYGQGHPMKPHRVRLTHQLILNYQLHRSLDVYRPHHASEEELLRFHTLSHIRFLQQAGVASPLHEKAREDCPIFENMFEFSQICAGASIDAAMLLNHGLADVCINWAGGLHHAKKSEASGFCYINDIVLAILELLKYHDRVLYLDIDAHHGDGVEEAFYTTNRVMTVSFHKFGNFFPGTGDISDVGEGQGRFHALNVPLRSGMDDLSYEHIFVPIAREVIYHFQPNAIVLQCGSDSLAHDKLGKFNLTNVGHGNCVKYVKGFGLPTLMLGGGGYTVANVARCWTYETGIMLGKSLPDDIPTNDYYEYYGPGFKLHVEPDKAMENRNTREYLETCVARCLDNIRRIEGAPSVQKQDRLPDFLPLDTLRKLSGKENEAEFYDSETR